MKPHVSPFDRYLELAISTGATVGALISATFLIYSYLLNSRAQVETQMPKILLQVRNGETRLIDTGPLVHMTHIHYRNIGTVECVELAMFAALVRDNERIDIPHLFRETMNLQIEDQRD